MSFTVKEREAFENALSLAQSSASSPSDAAANASQLAKLLGKAAVGLRRRTTATRLFQLPIGAPGQVVVASGAVSPIPSFNFTWPDNWHIVGLKAMIGEGATLLSHVKLQLVKSNGDAIFLSSTQGGGGVAGAVSFANLQGPYDPTGYLPLDLYVTANSNWNCIITSGDTSGSATYTPEVVFMVEPWDPMSDPAPTRAA